VKRGSDAELEGLIDRVMAGTLLPADAARKLTNG
jgi:hypothetical protein